MRHHTKWPARVALLLCGAIILGTGPVTAAEDTIISIGAGNTVGVYYAASSAMAKIFNQKRPEFHQRLITVASQGSEENINNVLQGKLEFGLAQSDMLYRAQQGLTPWAGKPHKNIQAVLGLHTEALTIVAASDKGIAKLADLVGKRVNIGAPGSSDEENAKRILLKAGIRVEDLTISQFPSSMASELLTGDRIDAYFFTVGHPNLSVREATSGQRKAVLLPLDKSLIDLFQVTSPLAKAVTIPTDQYPGLANRAAIPTVGVQAVLFTREGMSEETVYRLVKEVMTNLDLFRRQQPALADLTAMKMATVPVIPLHPGAQRYFREAGLLE
jgi:TRAP transporter TAXI family solute receptor